MHRTGDEAIQGGFPGIPSFTEEQIASATHDYSKTCVLGSGGFGKVYRGDLPGLGPAAIKVSNRPQDHSLEKEVLVLRRYHHPCMVQLLGSCWTPQTKALVYELMSGGNLYKVISDQEKALKAAEGEVSGQRLPDRHDNQERHSKRQKQEDGEYAARPSPTPLQPKAKAHASPAAKEAVGWDSTRDVEGTAGSDGATTDQAKLQGKAHPASGAGTAPHVKRMLTWRDIIRICYQVASALAYLHSCEPAVVHRDVKPGNILLDDQGNAKLGDVGIATVVPPSANASPAAAASAVGPHRAAAIAAGAPHSGRCAPARNAHPAAAATAAPGGHHAACPSFLVPGVAGTDDYLDPIYAQLHQLSPVSDVYALGLCMAQLVLCQKDPKASKNVLKHWSHEHAVAAHLPQHLRDWPDASVATLSALAVRCAAHQRQDRPSSVEVRDTLFQLLVEAELKSTTHTPSGMYSFEGTRTSGHSTNSATPGTPPVGSARGASPTPAEPPPAGTAVSRGGAAGPTPATAPRSPASAWSQGGSAATKLRSAPASPARPSDSWKADGTRSPVPNLHPVHVHAAYHGQAGGPSHSHHPPSLLSQQPQQLQQPLQVSAVLQLDANSGAVGGYMYVASPGVNHDAPEAACPVLNGTFDSTNNTLMFSTRVSGQRGIAWTGQLDLPNGWLQGTWATTTVAPAPSTSSTPNSPARPAPGSGASRGASTGGSNGVKGIRGSSPGPAASPAAASVPWGGISVVSTATSSGTFKLRLLMAKRSDPNH